MIKKEAAANIMIISADILAHTAKTLYPLCFTAPQMLLEKEKKSISGPFFFLVERFWCVGAL